MKGGTDGTPDAPAGLSEASKAPGQARHYQEMARQVGLKLSQVQRPRAKLDVLIIDEIGYVPFAERAAELSFQVVAESYERQSIIITTNLDFAKWPQVFHSEQLTGALLDRLTHHAHILTMNGESYRFKQSMSRKKKQ